MIKLLRLAAVVAAALVHGSCLPLVDGVDIDLSGQIVRLSILHTSDIHSRLIPYDFTPLKTDVDLGLIPDAAPFGGVTRLGALLARERQNADRVLHLDSGDSFQGAPIFNVNKGEVEFRFLSTVGVDAAVIGNHEFDAGAVNFTQMAQAFARFPLLAANYVWMDAKQLDSNQTGLYTQPYIIRNLGGLRVGIIGLANISSLNSIVEGGNSLQITPLEQNEAVRGYVEFLKPVVDLVMVVSHAGLTEDQELIHGYDAFFELGRIGPYVNRAYDPWVVQETFGTEGDPKAVVRVRVPGVRGVRGVDAIMGGHLHIVLNPPQLLTDPSGRKVILSHGGAFSKYLIRLDAMIQMPPKGGGPEGAEIVSHDFKVFPVDGLWCSDAIHQYYKQNFWNPGQFARDPKVRAAFGECTALEDKLVTQLLERYVINLDQTLQLASVFGFAPRDIARRNNSTGGDSPLGNLAADAMRRRKRVEAEVAVTNSLGIRDNLYAGVLTQESMFNVFPFENTINVMFLSGREMQELFDFIADRSAGRGCVSQAQISGARFTMDCAQVQLNDLRWPCDPAASSATDACRTIDQSDRRDRAPWQCIDDSAAGGTGRCWAHPGWNITINDKPLDPNLTYRVAVNDYIAKGGSGFLVLKRNTTRVETGIPLRDSLVGYLADYCTCEDLEAGKTDASGNRIGSKNQLCGVRVGNKFVVEEQVFEFCRDAAQFSDKLNVDLGGCTCAAAFRRDAARCTIGAPMEDQVKICQADLPAGPNLGKCGCRDALAGDPACGTLTRQVRDFCENPLRMPITFGFEDGRITRRVK